MRPPLRRCATAIALCSAIIAVTTAAEARKRKCTNRELGRISDAFILDCTKKPGWSISCQ